jgi:hypothetical protein
VLLLGLAHQSASPSLLPRVAWASPLPLGFCHPPWLLSTIRAPQCHSPLSLPHARANRVPLAHRHCRHHSSSGIQPPHRFPVGAESPNGCTHTLSCSLSSPPHPSPLELNGNQDRPHPPPMFCAATAIDRCASTSGHLRSIRAPLSTPPATFHTTSPENIVAPKPLLHLIAVTPLWWAPPPNTMPGYLPAVPRSWRWRPCRPGGRRWAALAAPPRGGNARWPHGHAAPRTHERGPVMGYLSLQTEPVASGLGPNFSPTLFIV